METSASLSSTSAHLDGAARCSHFGSCGGCQFQDLAYPDQLARKAALMAELFQPLGWTQPIGVAASPDVWYYRNKMEFSFQDVYPAPPAPADHLLLGLKRKKRWDKVMNLSECFLLSKETGALLESVHRWALDHRLEPYNLHRHVGFLRHLVVREAKNGPDRMVMLVTSPGKLPAQEFVDAVRAAYPATTILWTVNGKVADVARGDKAEILFGPGTICEKVLDRTFRISPYSFFQTNTRGAEKLYSMIRDRLADVSARNVLDLYCGSGGITLSVADKCAHVLGVELVASAVEDARHNAAQNGIRNIEFLEAPVEEILPSLAQRELAVDTVVVDPPRSGLHPTAAKALKELSPKNVLYVACNPKALAEDIRRLSDWYRLERLEAVDLFPHTEHIELLAVLRSIY